MDKPKLPLRVNEYRYIVDADGEVIAAPASKELAQFLIQTCNSYEMMVEAAERALNYIENTEGELGIKLDSGGMLRAALSHARGEG